MDDEWKLVELGYPLRAKASEQSLLIRNKPRSLSKLGAITRSSLCGIANQCGAS